jgi:polysaccharide export outer membrane protein
LKALLLSALLLIAPMGVTTPLVAQQPTTQAAAAPSRDTSVVLHPGDMVKVTVWRNQEMSGDFQVGVNGALRHPLYQEVPIAGIPLSEVEKRLTTFLERFVENPQLVVEPLFQVTVGGQVRTPNLYPLPRTTTIAQAIALAGGVTPDGRLDKVKLFRGGRQYQVDLTDPSGQWANEPIQSGDQLIVDKKSSVFRNIVLPLISMAGAIASIVNVATR